MNRIVRKCLSHTIGALFLLLIFVLGTGVGYGATWYNECCTQLVVVYVEASRCWWGEGRWSECWESMDYDSCASWSYPERCYDAVAYGRAELGGWDCFSAENNKTIIKTVVAGGVRETSCPSDLIRTKSCSLQKSPELFIRPTTSKDFISSRIETTLW